MKTYYSTVAWVDEYCRKIAPYIHVREADSLLIKVPNQAFKLNPQGLKVLKYLLGGGRVHDIVDRYEDKEGVSRDIHYFFTDLLAFMKGCYRENQKRVAVDAVPFTLPYNTLPVLSELAITYRCNLKCRFCYAACGCRKQDESPDLPPEKLKTVLDIIRREAEVPSVSFTGGEPTLRNDLPQLVRHAKSLEMWVNLISNGTLVTAGLAKKLRAAGLDSAQISVEGGSAELHDRIVACPGAFERTLAGIKNLREAGIRVHTNTTVSGLNKAHLAGIAGLVKKLGLGRFSMNMLMPVGSATAEMDRLFVSYSEIGGLVLGVRREAEKLGLEFMWYSPTPMCIFNPVAHGLGNKGCAACDGLLSVAPNGDILPCSSYPKPMGNLLANENGFRRLWESAEFRHFQTKSFAHELCHSCEHLAVCNGGCPLYWEKAGYDELLARNSEEYGKHG
ncbi:MAG: radical SAM protein [Elusimicrobiaceae bacterium]|nr:radical SAM protein [Elusimicrobiaceae bacterium]